MIRAKQIPKAKRTAGAPVDSSQLKSFVDRLDNLAEEREALGDDTKEVLKEAKGVGFSAKALRKIVAEKRRKTDAELEADLEVYRAALGMPGATYRSVAQDLGVPKSTLHRLVPKSQNGTVPPHDADGVVIELRAAILPSSSVWQAIAAAMPEPPAPKAPEPPRAVISDTEALDAMLEAGANWNKLRSGEPASA